MPSKFQACVARWNFISPTDGNSPVGRGTQLVVREPFKKTQVTKTKLDLNMDICLE